MSGNSADSFSENSEVEEEKEEVKEKIETMVKKKRPGRPPRKKKAPVPPPTTGPPAANDNKRRSTPVKSGNGSQFSERPRVFYQPHIYTCRRSLQENAACWSVPGRKQSELQWRRTSRGTSWSWGSLQRRTASAAWNSAPCWWATIETGEPSSSTSTTASSCWRSRGGGKVPPSARTKKNKTWIFKEDRHHDVKKKQNTSRQEGEGKTGFLSLLQVHHLTFWWIPGAIAAVVREKWNKSD